MNKNRVTRSLIAFLSGLFALSTACAADDTPTPMLPAAAQPAVVIPPAPTLDAKSYVLMDANSGMVVAEKDMNKRIAPASLTKLMTLYVTFSALKNGQIHLTDSVRISEKAWRTGGSRMFIREGSQVPVNLLIQGVIVASGNDSCVALAEYVGSSENTFAQMMNQAASQIGMKNTHFTDSTGLPHPNHYATTYDLALLAHALIRDFPEYYHFFSQKWLTYNKIKQPNRNRLLWRDKAVDGLKTGHTQEAGFCLIASGKRDDSRFISVLTGASTDSARANASQALLNYGFRFYKTHLLFNAHKAISTPRVWLGKKKTIALGVAKPLFITTPIGQYKNVKADMTLSKKLTAPITKGQRYGQINVMLNGKIINTTPLIALEDNPQGGWWSRMIDHIILFFSGWFGGS